MTVRIGHNDKTLTTLHPDPVDPRCLHLKLARYRGATSGISMQLWGPRGGFRSTKWVSNPSRLLKATIHLLRQGGATLGEPGHTRVYLSRDPFRAVDHEDDHVSFCFIGPQGGIHGKAVISLADFVSLILTLIMPPFVVPIAPGDTVLAEPGELFELVDPHFCS